MSVIVLVSVRALVVIHCLDYNVTNAIPVFLAMCIPSLSH